MSDTTAEPSASRVFDQKYCSGCGELIHRTAPLCPRCGAPQADVQSQIMNVPKSRTLAVVLALFLGGLGAHKFYLNRPGMGFLYLLFFWTFIPAIIALVEAIIYICMSDEAFARRFSRGASTTLTPTWTAPAPSARTWTPDDGKRPVTFLLGIGILFMPVIFVWFLLRSGYSPLARCIGFIWLALLVSLEIIAVVSAPAPRPVQASSSSAPAVSSSPQEPQAPRRHHHGVRRKKASE